MIHVYSDASVGRLGFAGAYIVGNGPPIGVSLAASNSTEAEMLTLAAAVRHARKQYPTSPLIVHTDLEHIKYILARNRARGSMVLRTALEECAAEIRGDGNQCRQHKLCHNHARVVAGIRGLSHPKMPKQPEHVDRDGVVTIPKRTYARDRYKAVVEVLVTHDGAGMRPSTRRGSQDSAFCDRATQRDGTLSGYEKSQQIERVACSLKSGMVAVLWKVIGRLEPHRESQANLLAYELRLAKIGSRPATLIGCW